MVDNEASSVYSLQSLSNANLVNNNNNNASVAASEDFNKHYLKHKSQLITSLNEKNLHSHLGLIIFFWFVYKICVFYLYLWKSLDYKSGAVYSGGLEDNLKCGQGEFEWPNGDKYSGEFILNHRHGYGIQTWFDGSEYQGQFEQDKRNGKGKHVWSNSENYDGNWFLDYRHGYGKYQWYDSNVYFGMFFMNNREGYLILNEYFKKIL